MTYQKREQVIKKYGDPEGPSNRKEQEESEYCQNCGKLINWDESLCDECQDILK